MGYKIIWCRYNFKDNNILARNRLLLLTHVFRSPLYPEKGKINDEPGFFGEIEDNEEEFFSSSLLFLAEDTGLQCAILVDYLPALSHLKRGYDIFVFFQQWVMASLKNCSDPGFSGADSDLKTKRPSKATQFVRAPTEAGLLVPRCPIQGSFRRTTPSRFICLKYSSLLHLGQRS